MRLHFRRLILLCALATNAAAAPRGSTLDGYLSAAGCLRVPLERQSDNKMLVRGTLNGKPLVLCVDTGSAGTLIDVKRLQRFGMTALGPQRNVYGVFGSGLPTVGALARSVTLGNLRIASMRFRAADLRLGERLLSPPIDGLLGIDFLAANHAIIDCVNAKLYFPPPSAWPRIATEFREGLLAGGAAEAPISKTMTVQATLRDHTFLLLLDTGSSFTSIDQSQFDTLRLRPGGNPFFITGIGDLRRNAGTATVKNLRLGKFVIREATLGVWNFSDLNTNLAQQGAPRIHGLLGCELLWQHGAIIDCGNGRLFLTRRSGPTGR